MNADAPLSDLNDEKLVGRLEGFWRAADGRMSGLPVHNPALAVMVTPVRRFGRFRFAAVVTPWCMNVVAIPDPGIKLPPDGVTLRLELPAGDVDFVVASMDDGDRYGTASLFSPMDEFDDQMTAEEVALAALDELLREADPSEVESLAVSLDRRRLLGLGRSPSEADR
ncbi:[NiFe]-hydrogenase assembly, chaperone, HybE [Pleomorphomonas diazotrophica]|uniref:[NiFe]-hydrogenase assembly, chaperone, HybE n=1 Tax=Pleomorphomonas diazotrophica TaxID=1166257 RepID=A0A1I4QA09_9HYPH|nr:[NiFe]-hydrogenase assembly chaperone HybE [Pleomorphomonas diazotrophica]PKR90826.1 [NiFe]-hydrogenase assembly, chaperone, HybE [Pleomorphomonas diazotrophica]SFM36932.1 [NiFe] hydrogenase assembly chaperone, HybE family [Pleomorphomonas diazotrophica]